MSNEAEVNKRLTHFNYHRTSSEDKLNSKNRIYYGIELERANIKDKRDTISDMKQAEGYKNKTDFYFQSDPSLVNGIELTFQPRTLQSWYDYHTTLYNITIMLQTSDSLNAGIHIHRSNKDITSLMQVKIIVFFVKCREDIIKLADRNVHFANYFTYCDSTNLNVIYKKVKNKELHVKSSAVNFAHKHTIEFRIFRSTLDLKRIYSYIEFCHYIIKFLKQENILSIMQANNKAVWYSFITWLIGENSRCLLELLQG